MHTTIRFRIKYLTLSTVSQYTTPDTLTRSVYHVHELPYPILMYQTGIM